MGKYDGGWGEEGRACDLKKKSIHVCTQTSTMPCKELFRFELGGTAKKRQELALQNPLRVDHYPQTACFGSLPITNECLHGISSATRGERPSFPRPVPAHSQITTLNIKINRCNLHLANKSDRVETLYLLQILSESANDV